MSASAAIVGLRPLRVRVASSRACAASASASAPAFGLGGEPKALAVSGAADGAGMTPRSGGMMRGGDFVVDAPHPMTHFTIGLAARAGGDCAGRLCSAQQLPAQLGPTELRPMRRQTDTVSYLERRLLLARASAAQKQGRTDVRRLRKRLRKVAGLLTVSPLEDAGDGRRNAQCLALPPPPMQASQWSRGGLSEVTTPVVGHHPSSWFSIVG